MQTIELFAGTKSFSKVAEKRGFKTWTTDNDIKFDCDLTGNVLNPEVQDRIMSHVKIANIVWMSPPCEKWSLAAGNTWWTEYRMPRREESIEAIKIMMFCRFVADYCEKNGKIFFIENPNGRAVWIMDNRYLHRVWYCKYGDTRAKPTNIWTNLKGWTPKTCFNGNPNCHHERAPRGSKTGTQGIGNYRDRSRIPPQLFEEIFDVIHGGKSLLQYSKGVEKHE